MADERDTRRGDDTPEAETVTVEALQDHTCDGKSYETGDVYEAPAELVDTLVAQGKAKPVEEKEREPRREPRLRVEEPEPNR